MRLVGHLLPEGVALYQGEGCHECSNTGYYGTTGIFEVVQFDDELRAAVLENTSLEAVRPLLVTKKIKSLKGSAMDKVIQGVTTLEEVIRVTGGDTK